VTILLYIELVLSLGHVFIWLRMASEFVLIYQNWPNQTWANIQN